MIDGRNFVIAGLIALLVWFGFAVVQLERYRYAAMLAECGLAADALEHARQQACLTDPPELRESPFWDLAYGLGVF